MRGRVIRTCGEFAEDLTNLREIMGSGCVASVVSHCADNYGVGISDASSAGFRIVIEKIFSFRVPVGRKVNERVTEAKWVVSYQRKLIWS
jgi:hypothetical protein